MPNYSGQQNSSESKFEDIVQLLRSTGFSPNQIKRTQKYPESFFKRILIPEHFVRMVVGRLRSDDIYNQVRKYIKEKIINFFFEIFVRECNIYFFHNCLIGSMLSQPGTSYNSFCGTGNFHIKSTNTISFSDLINKLVNSR